MSTVLLKDVKPGLYIPAAPPRQEDTVDLNRWEGVMELLVVAWIILGSPFVEFP